MGVQGNTGNNEPRLVVIDDNPDDRALIIRHLERELPGVQIIAVTGPEMLFQVLDIGAFDAVVTDYQLGWSDGITVLQQVKARYPGRSVIMFTNTGSEEIAVEAMKRGLDDYLIKTRHSFSRLPAAVRAVLERQQNRHRLAHLEAEQAQMLTRERAARQEAEVARAEAEASRARVQVLAEASASFVAAQLDLPALLEQVTRLIATAMGDLCGITLRSEDGRWLNPVGLYHVNPEALELLRLLLAAYPYRLGEGITGQVAATGKPAMFSNIDPVAYRGVLTPEYWPYLDRFAPRSGIVVPLRVREHVIGTLAIARGSADRPYTPEDQQLLQDLADRAALAIENARLYAAAQAAITARDEFFAVASHELRTPLAALLGHIDLMQRRAARDGNLPDQYRRLIAVITTQGQRLNRLITALLDFSRMETGQLQLEMAPFDLGTLASQIVEEFQPRTTRHTLTVNIPRQPVVILGDELRLGQVLFNLIQNAVSYSPAGGPVEVRVWRDAVHAYVQVRDVGMGIPADILPHIFQRFYRAPGINNNLISGMGLGLFIVQEIVSRHGGTITVTSDEGAGSTFTVTLSLADHGAGATR